MNGTARQIIFDYWGLTHGTARVYINVTGPMGFRLDGVDTMQQTIKPTSVEITINLSSMHLVTKGPRDGSWNAQCIVDLTRLEPEIVARLAVHGLVQKIADAASGAKTEAEAIGLMEKVREALYAGDWTVRTASVGVTDEQAALINAVGKLIRNTDKRKEYNAKGIADKLAIAEKNRAQVTDDMLDAELGAIIAKREERARIAELRNSVSIEF